MKVYALIGYYNDYNDHIFDAFTIGIFGTKELAINRALEKIRRNFDDDDSHYRLRDDERFSCMDIDNISWNDIEKYFREDLENGKCEDKFDWWIYKISEHNVEC